jgi:hypothetical protein
VIVPDDKDWTWVLDRPCPECGFDASAVDPSRVGAMVRANAEAWELLLTTGGPGLARRDRPDRWSALEYACHVRDVFRVYDGRLARMLAEDGPRYENWDQDATAAEQGYGDADPSTVATELAAAAEAVADRFDTVSAGQWERTGHRGDGADFTVETLARYFVHDPIHHLWDVGAAGPAGEAGPADAGGPVAAGER